jgi:DNA-binding transcriptional ArsR family regulator
MSSKNSHEALTAEAIEMVATRFRILGEPLRIRLIQELQGGEKTVSELVDALTASQPNVSKHLRLLQGEGVVDRRTEGNLGYYFISDPTVLDLCDAVCSSIGDRLSREAKFAAELRHGLTGRQR